MRLQEYSSKKIIMIMIAMLKQENRNYKKETEKYINDSKNIEL